MKTVLYLIQASAGLPKIYSCLRKRNFLILSYKENTADTTIFAPKTTWTEGRNLLYNYVRGNGLLYDYYVFMDEDIAFLPYSIVSNIYTRLKKRVANSPKFNLCMNQDAGFASLEESLELGYPIVNMCFYYNGIKIKKCTIQTISYFDAILNAISREVFFADTVLPYEEKYDSESWWISQAIFIFKAHYYYPKKIIQNNQFYVLSLSHKNYPQAVVNWIKIQKKVSQELQVPTIQICQSQALPLKLPPQRVKLFLSRQLKVIIRTIIRKRVIKQCIFYLFYRIFRTSSN